MKAQEGREKKAEVSRIALSPRPGSRASSTGAGPGGGGAIALNRRALITPHNPTLSHKGGGASRQNGLSPLTVTRKPERVCG